MRWGTYGTSNVFPEQGMLLVGSHVEQRLVLAEATGNVVAGLIGIPVIDFGELGVVVDQQQSWGNANDGAFNVQVREVSFNT